MIYFIIYRAPGQGVSVFFPDLVNARERRTLSV
jgi:hypothetical protein